MKKIPILTAWLLFVITPLFPQQGFTFNRISTDDGIGLASNVVYCSFQDAKGFIWVGTANGLQRFDGSKFIRFTFDKDHKNTLQVSTLTQIVAADSGALWLSFPNRQEFGIFNPATYQYTIIPIKTKLPLIRIDQSSLWRDSKGETFVSVYAWGILHYDKNKKAFIDDNYFHFPKGLVPHHATSEDTVKHQYWFPCGNDGLAVYDATSKELYTNKYNPKHIPLLDNKKIVPATSDVYIDSKRRYWVFNWPDVHHKRCFDSTGKELTDTAGINYNPQYSEMRNFFETKQGVLWAYGANALYNFDNNTRRFFYYDHGIVSSTGIHFQYVYGIMEDHDGSIWVSTDDGIYFTSPGSGTLGVVNTMFNNNNVGVEITDVIELQSGQRWLSTWGNGVITLGKDMIKYDAGIYKHMPQLDNLRWTQFRQAWALYQDIDGKVWIGCQGGNYMVYDTTTKKTQFLNAAPIKGATIRYITGDKRGTLWFGSIRGTLAKYDGKKFTVVQELGSWISKILVDKDGLLWVSPVNNGLFCLSADGTKILHHYTANSEENALFNNNGKDIEQLNDTTIVFGAGAMNFINKRTGKVHWLTFEDGLPSNTIQRMRMDADGYLWMITMNGLCRYNPATKRITAYGRKDGITVANFTTEADFLGSNGQVMFAGYNALLYFHPSTFRSTKTPDVVITDLKLFNTYLPLDSLSSLSKVQFNSNQNSFSIYFSALSYLQKEKLTYYYKMSGIDEDWVKADRQNFINYSLLPPGNYTFSIYCEDIDGARSKNITQLHLYIKPPIWRTYWFFSTFLFVVMLCIYFVHRLRVNKLLAVEKLRNRVARDLHDDMGSTLSTINILSSMAKSRISGDPVKTTEYLGKISDNSQRMMDAMDDIVWSIKPSNDSMQKIAARMREFAISVLEAREIEMDFRIDEAVFDVKLNMEARRDFFLVFKEAVNNAAKYSKASMVTIQLGHHNKRLIIIVSDNGIGFDPVNSDNGNGMGNMQKRADAMHGRLQVTSTPGNGTQVTLNIPVQ